MKIKFCGKGLFLIGVLWLVANGYIYAAADYALSDEEWVAFGKLQTRLSNGELSQRDMNVALFRAAKKDHLAIIESLLDPARQIKPDQIGINGALEVAASCYRLITVGWLLNRPVGQLRPDQVGINSTLVVVAGYSWQQAVKSKGAVNEILDEIYGRRAIVELLLNRPAGQLQPDQDSIIDAYRGAVAEGRSGIIRLLEPLVPFAERQNNRAGNDEVKGIAFEIHDYSSARINANDGSSSSGTAVPKQVKLVDAVFQNMQDRLA